MPMSPEQTLAAPSGQSWHTTAEAARYCRMSTKQLLRYARSGQVRGEQVSGAGGTWRFHTTWLDAFLSSSSRPARAA